MVPNKESFEISARASLKRAGLKATPQRLAVIDSLSGNGTHPTAQDLFEALRPRFPTMSFATVYNTLSTLSELGCVQRLIIDDGTTRFDPNGADHDHAVCASCGSVRDVFGAPKKPQGQPSMPDGFQVHRVEHIYRGLCASCREQAR